MWHKLTPAEENRRDTFMLAHHLDLSKKKGDYHFMQAMEISGDGDYILGQDDGEPPQDYKIKE